jgi:hypothetical protein
MHAQSSTGPEENFLSTISADPTGIGLFPTLPPPVPELPDHLVRGAMVLANHNQLFQVLPKGKVIAEIGVALGYFTRSALSRLEPASYLAIDSFQLHELESFWGRPPADYFGEYSHKDWYAQKFAREIDAGVLRLLPGNSDAVLNALPDQSIDIALVDADHSYDGVKRDLDALASKIRPDGTIIIDDYILVEQLNANYLIGVIYATHEFMIEHGWAMHYLALQPRGYYRVLLRRVDQPPPRNARIDELMQEVALLRNSTSWRITAPLRQLRQLFS